MRPAATLPAGREAGFSLVEIMVALAIVSMLSVTAIVSLPPGTSPARQEADRLVLRLEAARRQVRTTGETIGFAAHEDASGYAFMSYTPAGWRVLHGDRLFAPYNLAAGLSLVRTGGLPRGRRTDRDMPAPDVWFDPAGGDMAATYRLEAGQRAYTIEIEPAAPVRVRTGEKTL